MQIHELNSGFLRSPEAINNVQMVRGGAPIEVKKDDEQKTYVAIGNVQGRSLAKGMVVLASYNEGNQGADLVEVLGFTSDKEHYGEGGVAFESAKEMLKHYGVKSLQELEDLQDKNEYGYHSYLVVRDLNDDEEGAWYYLYEGRWARGSGAEKLSFVRMNLQ